MRKLLRLVVAGALLLYVPLTAAKSIFSGSFSGERYMFVVAIATLIWIALTHSNVLVYTPGDEGAVVEDALTGGKFFPLGTGINAKFPWEKLCADRKVSTKTRTSTGKENFLTKDGVQLSIEWAFTWRPDIGNLAAFFLVDEKTIEKTIQDKVQAWLTQKCAANTAQDIRSNLDNTDPTKFCLTKQFEMDFVKKESPTEPGNFIAVEHDFEKKFGVEIIQILPNDIAYPDAIQDAKNAQAVRAEIGEIAKQLVADARASGDQKYSFSQALNDALILVGKTQGVNIKGAGKGGTILSVGKGGTP